MNRLSVLYVADRLIASSILGVVKPLLELQEQGEIFFRMKYAGQYREKDIEWADVVVLCRSLDPALLQVIELVQRHNKRLVYDIDDNFFELSIQNPLGRYHRYPPHLYTVREMIRCADVVRVYSRPMEEIASAWNENTWRLKGYFDFKLIQNVNPKPHQKIRIVYASGRGNADPLAQICLPAVARILLEFPDRVEFYLFGKAPSYLRRLNNVFELKYIPNYNRFISFFRNKGFDIGLAPLLDDRFHNSKTNNKFREYGAMEVCGIYSSAEIYRECVRDHENGLLVENTPESWYSAMRELIDNAELRERVRENARQDVRKYYSMDNTLSDWRKVLSTIRGEKAPFKNYRNVVTSVLVDGQWTDRNFRYDQLNVLLGISKMDFKVESFQKADLQKLKDCDVCICFASSGKQAEQWIVTLRNYGFQQIIMDTLFPFDGFARYPSILFTNPAGSGENTFAIPDLYSLNEAGLAQAALKTLAMPGSDLAFHELFYERRAAVKENEEQVMSLVNPMSLWAELLSRYESDRKKSWLAKHFRAVSLRIRYVARILLRVIRFVTKPFVWFYHAVFDRMQWFLTCASGYIRVNIFKKY